MRLHLTAAAAAVAALMLGAATGGAEAQYRWGGPYGYGPPGHHGWYGYRAGPPPWAHRGWRRPHPRWYGPPRGYPPYAYRRPHWAY